MIENKSIVNDITHEDTLKAALEEVALKEVSLNDSLKQTTQEQTTQEQYSKDTNVDENKTIDRGYKYHVVVVGAFQNIVLAEDLIKQCVEKGFSSTLIPGKRKGLYIVSIESSNSIEAAEYFLDLARLKITELAWILDTVKYNFD